MTTLPIPTRLQKSGFIVFLVSILFIASFYGQLRAQRAAMPAQDCTTFAGRWRQPDTPDASWNITVSGRTASGDYRSPLHGHRTLTGTIVGESFRGRWNDDNFDRQRGGTFVANLFPAAHKIRVTFTDTNGQVESADWVCRPIGTAPTPTPTPAPTGVPTPPPSPTPTPTPDANSIRDDQDIDGFKLFDSIDPVEQRKVLVRRGPRLPVAYTATELPMRVLVKGGWPIILEYGLAAEELAMMSIQVADRRPFMVKLPPSPRNTINLHVPRIGSDELVVAKVLIKTADDDDEFLLYAFGMGEKATAAVRRINADLSHFALAMNNAGGGLASDSSLVHLLTSQVGATLQLSVSLPATLKVKQKPEQEIEFSCTSNSDYSEGRWEWWRVRGLDWEKVWQKGSGSISRDRPRSQKWNGIITQFKLVSKGFHALHFNAWQKAGTENEWVTARTDPKLEVIE
ncbi:MAG TPA: hypothetical protein VFR80_12565 [Pyrinomonadaceae bacterium]|nr:hypothetical protein [Pyrinomonadaceae bacterium]